MSGESIEISEHESFCRRLYVETFGEEYRPLHSLEEAKQFADGIVILEGDYGGQIYLTCPASMLQCSPETLHKLLRDIDARRWDDEDGARVFYERKQAGEGVVGGMGGGVVTVRLWLHPKVEAFGIRTEVEAILAGQLERLSPKT